MNIIIMNQSYFPNRGGIENSMYYIAKSLMNKGHNVTIYTAAFTKEQLVNESVDGINVKRYPFYKIAKRRYVLVKPILHVLLVKRSFKEAGFQTTNIDMIVSRDYQISVAIKSIFPNKKHIYIPPLIVASYRNELLKKLKKRKFTLKNSITIIMTYILKIQESYLQLKALKESSSIMCFSHNMKKQIIEIAFNKNSRLKIDAVVNPPGVDENIYYVMDKKINTDSLNEGNRSSVPVLLYVGRIVAEKNLELLIESVHLSEKNFKLLLVGTGNYKKELEKKVKKLNLEEKIKFEGETDNPSYYYNMASYTILPSTYEAFGQVLIESLSCGTPCIAFRSNYPKLKVASSEIIEEYKTGFLIEEPIATEMAKSIDKAFSLSSKEYREMSIRSVEKARKKYNWDKFTDGIIKMID